MLKFKIKPLSLLLHIDAAFQECLVVLSNNEEVIAQEKSEVQKDHASFLQPAIQKICALAGIALHDLNAIAVTSGPGSYTGLRVGLASAKGICYSLNKPLILLNTLDLLAQAIKIQGNNAGNVKYCPMIDARRMEVFTALYDKELKLKNNYSSVIVDDHFLEKERADHVIIVGGNGCTKLKQISTFKNIQFGITHYSTSTIINAAVKQFQYKNFANLAYSEPFYLKPVFIR